MDEDFSGVDMSIPDVVADQEELESTIGNDGIVRAPSPDLGGETYLTYSEGGTPRKIRELGNQSTGQRKNGKRTFRR
jgi:hypothetical protein